MRHLVIAILLVKLAAISGCGSSNADNGQLNDDGHGHHHHHDNLHKPLDYQSAMSRLAKLHQAILDGKRYLMPDHRQTAHAHHHHHGDGHAHHERVDTFTEMHDIAKWLPDLAADSDLPKEPWDKISKHSKKLISLLDEVVTEKQADDYRTQSEAVVGLLAKLDSLAPETDEAVQPIANNKSQG